MTAPTAARLKANKKRRAEALLCRQRRNLGMRLVSRRRFRQDLLRQCFAQPRKVEGLTPSFFARAFAEAMMSLPSAVVSRAIARSASSTSSLVILRFLEEARLLLEAADEEPRSPFNVLLSAQAPQDRRKHHSSHGSEFEEHGRQQRQEPPDFFGRKRQPGRYRRRLGVDGLGSIRRVLTSACAFVRSSRA